MNKQSEASTKEKKIVAQRVFGSCVDYFLFGLRSDSDFLRVATQLGDFFHCTLTMLNKYSIPSDEYQAKFSLAFVQFDFHKELSSPSDVSVDKLNLLLFQNRTTDFDKSKSPKAQKGKDGTFDYVDDVLGCYAVNSHGVYLQHSAIRDMNYFIMGYTKKGKDVTPFTNILQKFSYPLEDFSNNIVAPPKKTGDVVLLQKIFSFAEQQIDKTMKVNAESSRFVRA